ncbi:type II toxin-antitoxin system PemK/MazF family toxin [Cyclobacterium sp. SYSU L10401]|uniref:type II toxin-antitoxin system PemK/MazF family toxin n=1 Tax=unclassified Cyclobacterium TaxID=2615055 RepID=UPI0013D31B9F|nr:type II toxin-antitoxin system PemK/MazF family toxin [Cyclobacterium sp. SYSU L10401]
MAIKKFEIWVADLNPQIGTEPVKKMPVLVIQTNLLNKIPHPYTVVCPITTNVREDVEILRVHLNKGVSNLNQPCDIMIDQVRAIDNRRLTKRLGTLPDELTVQVRENIRIVLDLD